MQALRYLIAALGLVSLASAASPATTGKPPLPPACSLRVEPPAVKLVGPRAEQSLLVTLIQPLGQERDATHKAKYTSSNPAVASVSPEGLVRIVGNGSAVIR